MIHSPRFIAVLDACVLYPVPVRDLLLHLASVGLFISKRYGLTNTCELPSTQQWAHFLWQPGARAGHAHEKL